jgi:ATP-dependent Zn protease
VTASTYFGQSCLQVTSIAKQMVINYGFSDIGPWSLMDPNAQQGDMIMRMMARNSMSEALQVRLVSCSVLALLRC